MEKGCGILDFAYKFCDFAKKGVWESHGCFERSTESFSRMMLR